MKESISSARAFLENLLKITSGSDLYALIGDLIKAVNRSATVSKSQGDYLEEIIKNGVTGISFKYPERTDQLREFRSFTLQIAMYINTCRDD